MKKILYILSAVLLGLAVASCAKEQFRIFDRTKATVPVLTGYNIGEETIEATFTPASFNMGFNENIPVNHRLVVVSVNGNPTSRTLTSKVNGSTITANCTDLSKMLLNMGFNEGDHVSVEILIRAIMQHTVDNGSGIGTLDSESRIKLDGFEVTVPKGSPYVDYTESSEWSVIGALSAYEISWDGDLNMWTDGNNHVAAHVTLKAGDEFKFRKGQAWAENFGGNFENLDAEFEVTQDGPNIKIGVDGVYDLYLNPTDGVAWVTAAYDPLPDYTESSNWSVIGALSLNGINWDGDIAMVSNGTWHVALGVNLAAADEFKFRQDAGWAVNLGGDFTSMDSEFEVSQDGPNIKVGAAGCFDLYVNPADKVAKVTEASGAKVSTKISNEEPPVEVITGWNIIGLNGDWENDVLATEENGVWTAYITAEGETTFKWRKDGGWDENYGGTFVTLGEPFEAVAGGSDIAIGAGFWKVVLDTNNLTITISNGQVWSLIGDFNEWSGDVDMTLTDGKWVSPVTKISGKFKIRENHGWDNNRGGVFVKIGEPFEAVAGGSDIAVEEGSYVVTYDPEAETIVIDESGWGVVGTITGWGNSPDIILKEDGNFLVARNIALTADDKIKIRYKSSWDENRGGRTAVGHAVKAVPGGDDIAPGAGNFDVWYRPDSEVLFVMPSSSQLSYWGVVGTINGWAAPDRIMYETADGKYVYEDLEIVATDAIKIRENEDWGNNRGGAFTGLGEAFAVENNGANIEVGRDATITVTYDPSAETITLTGEYHGDAPSLPETMYMIGAAFGNWSWEDAGIVELTPVNGKSGQFWTIRYIEAGSPFKFCAKKEWSGDFTGLGEDSGYTVDGGNCSVAENGVYMIYVDTDNKKLVVEPAKVHGIGGCWGNAWDSAMAGSLFVEKDGKLVGKTTSAGELRLYAESSAATSDWWTREFVILDGKIAYRGNGGDQERVNVPADATITLDFNAGTGMIEAGGGQGGDTAKITIDGDMSDWANIEGVTSESVYKVLKATNDDEFFYIYSMRNKKRGNELWGENKGYYYYDFDMDNNAETGDYEEGSHGKFEAWMYLYLFGGSADAPAFWESPKGSGKPSSDVIANVLCKGVVDDNPEESGLIETEVRIPRANLPAVEKGQTISITSWGNKDANLMKVTITVK